MTTTARGEIINERSGLCPTCSITLAQAAVFWTNDGEADGLTDAERFARLQREATDARRDCRENCGRTDPPASTPCPPVLADRDGNCTCCGNPIPEEARDA